MAYASGKYAKFICDTCGFAYPYISAKTKWNGNRVCNECFEPKNPQEDTFPLTVDAEALWKPRGEVSLPQAELGRVFTDNPGNVNPDEDLIGSKFTGYQGKSSVGILTVNTEDNTLTVNLSGLNVTSNLGTVTITGDISESVSVTGQSATGVLGTPTIASNVIEYAVTVAYGTNSYGSGNKFYIEGVLSPTLSLSEGNTYKFDQSNSSNATHPFRFSTTANGTHGGGSEYTTGVTTNGTPGSSGAYTQIVVAVGAPTLYYYCTNHSGMGGQANTP
tara:strand:- start:1604 stop:2428 length:825 start_codon:yes stop_codon:yes gene_type:complete